MVRLREKRWGGLTRNHMFNHLPILYPITFVVTKALAEGVIPYPNY